MSMQQSGVDHGYAVILAGGYGERFWPASTSKRPKQLLSLLGDRTMLEMAVDRLAGLIPPERVIVLTSQDLVAPTIALSPDLPEQNIIGEPVRRDTAAAVALACAVIEARDPDAVFCVLTADHVMGDLELFRTTLRSGMALAASRSVLVTIGITPTEASTAFGYVEAGAVLAPAANSDSAQPASETEITFRSVTRFVEKPDLATAQEYVDSGNFSWNSGMFIWSAAVVAAAFAEHQPALANMIRNLRPVVDTEDFEQALASEFEPLEKISIDYALMEKASNIVMAEGGFAWDDVGSWPAVSDHMPNDDSGNVTTGGVVVLDASNNIVLSEGRLTAVIGVEDLIVVHAGDATLVCPKDRAQDVKKIVTELRANPEWKHLL